MSNDHNSGYIPKGAVTAGDMRTEGNDDAVNLIHSSSQEYMNKQPSPEPKVSVLPHGEQGLNIPSRKRVHSGGNNSTECPSKKAKSNHHPRCSIEEWLEHTVAGASPPQPSSLNISPVPGRSDLGEEGIREPLTREALNQLKMTINDYPSNLSAPFQLEATPDFETTTLDKSKYTTYNATDPIFDDELELRGILIPKNLTNLDPQNLSEFTEYLRGERDTESPASEDFRDVSAMIDNSPNEATLVAALLNAFLPVKEMFTNKHQMKCIINAPTTKAVVKKFHNAQKKRMTNPQPDVIIGWDKEQFQDYLLALQKIGEFARPFDKARDLVFPTFAVEFKGPDGSSTVARRQNMWNSAVLLRNLYELKQMAGTADGDFFNKIKVVTIVFTTDLLEVNYHWAKKVNDSLIFNTAKYGSWNVRESLQVHKDGHKSMRNAMDWATKENKPWLEANLKIIQEKAVKDLAAAKTTATSSSAIIQEKAVKDLAAAKTTATSLSAIIQEKAVEDLAAAKTTATSSGAKKRKTDPSSSS